MNSKKTVVKVEINCLKCKTQVMKTVAKLTGIDEIQTDGEKGTLTVIGVVDPAQIVQQVRKIKKCAEIMSVGPPKPPETKPKPPETKPKPTPTPTPEPKPLPPCCDSCRLIPVAFVEYGRVPDCRIL